MNKNGEKVNRMQLKENERCLRDYQSGRLISPMTFDDCINADRNGKVENARIKTFEREVIKCDSLDAPPPYAYTNAATVNSAAVDGALALTYAIFGGSPVLDGDLVTKADDQKTARCQLAMLKRADLLESAVLKEVNKAKRLAIKDETVDSAAALEAKLETVFSSNDRIRRMQDSLVRQVDNSCAVLQVPPATVFPGECSEGDPSLRQIEVCVIEAARCEACLKINAFDNLSIDCDLADDREDNGSCESRRWAED
ncbi:MAG: hypothetical protein JRF15_13645 [Deltaproteobacteria bacterium]|jgi:hypothetical protein|nr:hypothetical protein [Deltaproteobacteria bacterium]